MRFIIFACVRMVFIIFITGRAPLNPQPAMLLATSGPRGTEGGLSGLSQYVCKKNMAYPEMLSSALDVINAKNRA